METNETFPAREANPADFAKLEGYNPKMAETSCAEVAEPGQRVAKQMRPGHCANQIHPGCPGVAFPVTYTSLAQGQQQLTAE